MTINIYWAGCNNESFLVLVCRPIDKRGQWNFTFYWRHTLSVLTKTKVVQFSDIKLIAFPPKMVTMISLIIADVTYRSHIKIGQHVMLWPFFTDIEVFICSLSVIIQNHLSFKCFLCSWSSLFCSIYFSLYYKIFALPFLVLCLEKLVTI